MSSDHIGRYEVRSELGRGGMAVVYHGYDPHFKREVAIKILPQEFMHDPMFRARFDREAQMIAALDHPAIVPVYDFGEENGQPFIVMRFMAGGALSGRIKSGTLKLDDVVRLVNRIAEALDDAHSKKIIHRDLKPENILFDQRGDAFISDFGLARISEGTSQLTGSGMVGTPGYMAPEMMNHQELGPSVDIYALGVTLYMMLTGTMPFQAETPVGLIMAHLKNPVPNIRETHPQYPEDLQYVLEKSMAKKPEDRYASAGALATDLVAALAEGIDAGTELVDYGTIPVAASGVKSGTGAKPASKMPLWMPIGGGVAVLAVVAAVVFGSGMLNPPAATEPPTTEAAIAEVTEAPTQPPTDTPAPTESATEAALPTPTSAPLPAGPVITAENATGISQTLQVGELDDTITSLDWSPDGTRLVVGTLNGAVIELDAASGSALVTHRWHTGAVTSVAWSPDGLRLASGGVDMTVMLWQAGTDEAPIVMTGHEEGVNAVAWSYDSSRIASASYDRRVTVWGGGTGKQLFTMLADQSDQVFGAAWSHGGLVATGSDNNSVYLWDGLSSALDRKLSGQTENITAVDWSPDDLYIASGASDGAIVIWASQNWQLLRVLRSHSEAINGIDWSTDSTVLASSSYDGRAVVWDYATGREIISFSPGIISDIAFSPDGTILAGASGGSILYWQVR